MSPQADVPDDANPCMKMPHLTSNTSAEDMASPALQDQYLEVTSSIPPSATLFGLGEFNTNTGFPLRRDGLPYTLWARDQPPAVPNINLYGSHPIILDVRDGNTSKRNRSQMHHLSYFQRHDMFPPGAGYNVS